MILTSDKHKKNYLERIFHEKWDNPAMYHLVLNSGKLGTDDTAQIIVSAVRKFSATREYVPGMRDRRCRTRRSGADRRKSNRRSGISWTQREIERAVDHGRPVRSHTAPDRRKGDRRISGRRKDK